MVCLPKPRTPRTKVSSGSLKGCGRSWHLNLAGFPGFLSCSVLATTRMLSTLCALARHVKQPLGQLVLAPIVVLSYFCIGIPSAWLSPIPGHRTAASLALGSSMGTATHTLAVSVGILM